MNLAPATRQTVNVSELLEHSTVGRLQLSTFFLCLLCMIVDGFDVQALGYTAPSIIREWRISGAALGPATTCPTPISTPSGSVPSSCPSTGPWTCGSTSNGSARPGSCRSASSPAPSLPSCDPPSAVSRYRRAMDLNAIKDRLAAEVDARADLLVEASHQLHARPELAFEEQFAHFAAGGQVARLDLGAEGLFDVVDWRAAIEREPVPVTFLQQPQVEEAMELAGRIASGPTFAHGITKTQLNQEWSMGLDQAIEAEAQAQAICMQTRDFERAYKAFVAKEKPVFEGN